MADIYYRNLHHKAHDKGRHEGTISIRVEKNRAYIRMPDVMPDPLHDFVVVEGHPINIIVGIDAVTGEETGYIKAERIKND